MIGEEGAETPEVPTSEDYSPRRLLVFQSGLTGAIGPILITTLLAFMMGGLVVALTGKNPFKVYHAIWNGTGLNWFFHVGNYSVTHAVQRRTRSGSPGTPPRSPRRTCSRRCS